MITQPDDYARRVEEYAAAVEAQAHAELGQIGEHLEPVACRDCGKSATACGKSGSFCCKSCAGEPGVRGASFLTHESAAMTATVPPVSPRPRGEVSNARLRRIGSAYAAHVKAEAAFRAEVVAALVEDGASFSELAKETGLSTNTLQRWKREARN